MVSTSNKSNKKHQTSTIRSRRGVLVMAVVTAFTLIAGAAMPVVTAQEAPEVDEIAPESGPVGTAIEIQGEGFTADSVVSFGGIQVESTVIDSERIEIEAPDIADGHYSIEVETEAGAGVLCCFDLTGTADEDEAEDNGAAEAPQDSAESDASCKESDMNIECTEMGRIAMESQRNIRGDYIDLSIDVTLNTAYADRDARWVLFSIRNVTADGTNPVRIDLERFYTQHGDVVTNNIEDQQPNEVNIWVHVLDVPIDEPMTLDTSIGVEDRGAYRLETLVMVFDRGYAPVPDDSGNDAKLFSFTLLGVNDETGGGGLGSSDVSNRLESLPAAPVWSVLAVIGAAAVAVARRSRE